MPGFDVGSGIGCGPYQTCGVDATGALAFTINAAWQGTDPAPPCLLTETSLAGYSGDTGPGIQNTGLPDDGLHDSPVATSSGGVSMTSASGTPGHYSIQTGSAWPVTRTLSAHGHSTAAASPNGASTGMGVHLGSYGLSATPILLSSPDPAGHPEQGDGTNQFVYDAAAPKGNLFLPGIISVAGASADAANWLVSDPQAAQSHVDVKVDLPAESVLTASHLQPSAGQLTYQYQLTPGGSYTDGMWFLGLPNSNSGFGNHLATLTVDGSNAQQAHIQTFFTGINFTGKTVANYPNAAGNKAFDGSIIPNWYYYYSQVYKPTAAQGGYDQSGQAPSHIDLTSPYTVHIHDDAYGPYTFPIYSLSKPIQTGEFVQPLGTLSVTGIHSYIFTCAHELGHQALSQQVDAGGNPVVYNWSPKDAFGNYTLPLTTDGDVVDAWEQTHHLDDFKEQTTLYTYSNTNDHADDEVIADIQGLGVLFAKLPEWSEDWADAGIQHGRPYFNPHPTGTQEGFYLIFTPADTTQSAFHVHTLDDLTTHYPSKTILSDVTQMVGP